MVTHSTILAWKIPWAEEPEGLQSMGSQRVKQDRLCLRIHAHTHTYHCIKKLLLQNNFAYESQVKSYHYRPMCSRWKCLQLWFSFILVSENYMKSRTFHSHPLKPLVLFQRSLSWLFSRDCTRAVILASVHPPPGSWRKKAHSIPARSVAPRHQHQAGALWASHLH